MSKKVIGNHQERLIDLHVHTTASDGNDSPTMLIQKAAAKGLAAIAITDHDTVKGVIACLDAAEALGVELVPGVELSVQYPHEMHIIGLYIDVDNKYLIQAMQKIAKVRMRLISKAFLVNIDLGINVSATDVFKAKKGLSLKYLIEYLLENRLIQNHSEAKTLYSQIWNEWQSCLPNPAECISFIHKHKGLAFLAHPKRLRLSNAQEIEVITQLQENALDGIECFHPDHTRADEEKYFQWANRLDLLCSGGSDYHAINKSETDSDTGIGNIIIPYRYLEAIKQKLDRVC